MFTFMLQALKLNLFLHPSEKCLLRRILSVAKDFATIKKFSEYVNGKVDGNGEKFIILNFVCNFFFFFF